MARKSKTEVEEEILEVKIRDYDIEDEMKQDFVTYAREVNGHRAFPYEIPGIKPIAGHALWAMWANKRVSKNPYTKSAKIEGEVMSYSPHAGSYSSLARMAANYIYHIPYIDGHGSFGSVVGGPTPGASRYTSMRLSKFSEDVFFYNTKLLDMGLNYLEEEEEPILKTWVALLPLLFITNTSGMGYTVSNRWSSGNLFEFREQLLNYLKTGNVDCSNVYPDFPTGGVIVNKSEMKNLYETGSGTIKLRGITEIDGNIIRITSLPYQVYPEPFIDDVKKYVTTCQNTVVDLRNMSGSNGILIEIECEEGTAPYTLEMLFKKTNLQVSISDEHKAITTSGKPELITLKDYIKTFVDSNIELVKKEAAFNLETIESRLEIVNGLLSALDIIDKIISDIKSSKSQEDARQLIMKNHGFTENQAHAIVGTTLGKLASLENIKLQKEKEELTKNKAENDKLLTSYKAQEKYFLNRFNDLIDKYAWERKTQVIDADTTSIVIPKAEKPEKFRAKKEFIVVLTDSNCIKRIDVAKFRQTEEDSKNIKVSGNEKVILVSNMGKMYKVWSNSIDKCMPTASGMSVQAVRPEIADNEKIIAIYSEDIDIPYIYFVTKNGLGIKCNTKNTLKISITVGTPLCKFKSEDDEVIAIKLLKDNEHIEITTNQRVETVESGDPQGRGASGKKIINLKANEVITEVHSTI